MSNTGNRPQGAGGASPGAATSDASSGPASDSGAAAAAGQDTAPASSPPDSAPASSPPASASTPTDSTPPASDGSPPASAGAPPSSQPAASKPPDSGGCAEIPTAAHAVLQAAFKLTVQLPTATDPNQAPHKFTLSNEDGSYSKMLTFPSDAQPGETDGISLLVFEDLTDGHTYTLQGEGDDGAYAIFPPTAYHDVVATLGGAGTTAAQDPSSGQDAPPASGGNG
jgi:hypothetical protein